MQPTVHRLDIEGCGRCQTVPRCANGETTSPVAIRYRYVLPMASKRALKVQRRRGDFQHADVPIERDVERAPNGLNRMLGADLDRCHLPERVHPRIRPACAETLWGTTRPATSRLENGSNASSSAAWIVGPFSWRCHPQNECRQYATRSRNSHL